jgi:hypothetical protein
VRQGVRGGSSDTAADQAVASLPAEGSL